MHSSLLGAKSITHEPLRQAPNYHGLDLCLQTVHALHKSHIYLSFFKKSIKTEYLAEGRSVAELTAVCKEISSKQKDYSDSDDSPVNRPVGSDEENDEPFIRHPFKVREAPLGIVMNIKVRKHVPLVDGGGRGGGDDFVHGSRPAWP